jgi:hypothetical protein
MTKTDPLFKPGPTFVCEFSDGVTTRMSIHCAEGLDLARGIKLSCAAYESRAKKSPPDILSGRFEDFGGGVLLQAYDAAEIAATRRHRSHE